MITDITDLKNEFEELAKYEKELEELRAPLMKPRHYLDKDDDNDGIYDNYDKQ